MGLVEVNGTQLWIEERGVGLSLLFVHGACGGAWVWEDQIERLCGRYRCVAYDRRGHSRSPGEGYSVATHADDAAALIERLGLAPCLVVSSSGGAEVAVELIRTHPEGIRGAVLSEPPLFSLDEEAGAAFGHQIGPAVDAAIATAGGDRRAAVDGFFAAVCPGLWSRIDEARKDRYRDNVEMLFAGLQGESRPLTVDDLARVRVPCLVLSGSISAPELRSIARKLAASVPDCRFVEFEACGHVTYAERPAEFAAAVETFADELAARA